ncbi:MAG: HAMP domain-containing histidine kinase, partial [Anaerolineae bacterium]|nr:HAMP domain-containing histidine kinase [Anaerolineae bacterium]
MTFRTKLILWYSGLLVIVIVIFGVSVYSVMQRTLVDSIDRALWDTANLVTNSSRVRLIGEFGAPNQRVFSLPQLDLFRASGVEVQVWSLDGPAPRLEAASINIRELDLPLNDAALGSEQPAYANVVMNGREMRVLTTPMFARGELLANVQAVALLSTVNEARENLLLVMSGAGLLAVGASVLVGMWLSRRALRPITGITAAAASIARTDDLSTRLNWTGPADELGNLVSVFNGMMARLQDLFSVQQRFVADVSHELRTPLTAIRGNLDLVKRYGMDDLSLEAIESETDRMARMVNDLLLLARADYGGLTLDLEPLDLDTVVLEAHQQAQVLVKDRDLMVILRQFEPVRIRGNADRVKQLLLNLLSNAIKFTPDGGRITLDLYRDHDTAVLEVSDTGIGIAAEDLKHIFERFWQADSSRVRATGTGSTESSGLGLSIVKWIVEAHGATISVESEPDKGTTFTVRFPVLAEGPHAGGGPHIDAQSRLNRLR